MTDIALQPFGRFFEYQVKPVQDLYLLAITVPEAWTEALRRITILVTSQLQTTVLADFDSFCSSRIELNVPMIRRGDSVKISLVLSEPFEWKSISITKKVIPSIVNLYL